MSFDDSTPTIKVLIIGPSGTGKSALLLKYCDDKFDADTRSATIGVDFKVKYVVAHGQNYRLHLLDTAGQERFRTLSTSYYRNAQGVILAYDISHIASFRSLGHWFAEAKANARPGAALFLVGCKLDKESARAVPFEEGRVLAELEGAGFCEASAKTGRNVRKPFVEIVEAVLRQPALLREQTPRGVTLDEDTPRSWCYC